MLAHDEDMVARGIGLQENTMDVWRHVCPTSHHHLLLLFPSQIKIGTCQPMNTSMHYSVIDLREIQAEDHTTTLGQIKKTQLLLCGRDPCHVATWEVPCHARLNQAPTLWVSCQSDWRGMVVTCV
jgi:hypothetical protein